MIGVYLETSEEMQLKRFFIIAIIISLLTVLQSDILNFSAIFATPIVVAQTVNVQKAEADRLLKQGLNQSQTSQFEAALQSSQQALTIYQQIADRSGELHSLEILGSAYFYLVQYSKAIDFYKQSLAIAQEIKDRQAEARSRLHLGLAFASSGDYPKGIEYYEQSLAIAQEIRYPDVEAVALNSLGMASAYKGDHAKAIEYYEQSLAITKKNKDSLGEGRTLGNMANSYSSLGENAKAIDYYEQRLVLARKTKDRLGEGLGLRNMGEIFFKQGDLTAAEKNFREGINVWELLRKESLGNNDADKLSFFIIQHKTYTQLQQVLIAQKKTDAALEIAELSRTRVFIDRLARQYDSNSGTKILPPTIQKIQQIAKEQNATLVEYSITPNKLFIWVINPTGEVTFRTADINMGTLAVIAENSRVAAATVRNRGTEKQNAILSDLPRGLYKSLRIDSNRGIFQVTVVNPTVDPDQYLKQLYQLLIQPIADLLPTNPEARVIFIPHQDLFLVPFPALIDNKGNYLIEKHTILTAPSIQILELTHRQRQRVLGQSVLVMGNPKPMPSVGEPAQQLKPLPYAGQEAEEIARIFNVNAITNEQATKAAILQQMPSARIIHLATHGLLDGFTGGDVPGAIALARSGKDNGLLTANEILNLKLSAELVVLSACDTGRGHITIADGVIGLSRSLILAGVPSVVVSLWQVPDKSTASLMTEFYRQLKQTGDKAKSLRQAMLKTMDKHGNNPNPRAWAAFTLVGEAK